MRAMGVCSFLADGLRQLVPCGFEVLVNYSVLELGLVGQFFARICEALPDHRLGILAALAHAPLELLDRGRHDEDADALWIEPAHLLRALPVDFQHHVVAACQRLLDHLARGAVVVAVDLSTLEEFPCVAHAQECRLVDEVVFAAVLLARPRRARGVGDRELEARVVLEQRVDQRALAGAGGRGDDEQFSRHSMFCTCSRICSTSTFNSSAQSASGGLAAFEAKVLASRLSSWARKSRRFPAAPPLRRTRSTSARCVRRRSISSSMSTFAANRAISARTRSSNSGETAAPSASRSRSVIFAL